MLSRSFIALGATIFLIALVSYSQEPKPAASAEKQTASPGKSRATPTPTEPPITFNSVHVYHQGAGGEHQVAITFDDGPDPRWTPKILDILKAANVKAAFFLVGVNAERYPGLVRRIVDEGHEIGNHTWSHPNLGKISDEAVRRELQKTDDAIAAAIGKRPTLMRPPYGSITARQKKWIHEEFGYKIIIWDVDPLDWKRPGPSVVTARILKETHAGSIVLSHDIHPPTIEAMPATFDQLMKKGFKSVTVTELLAMATPIPPKPTPSPSVPRAVALPSATPSASPPVPTSTP